MENAPEENEETSQPHPDEIVETDDLHPDDMTQTELETEPETELEPEPEPEPEPAKIEPIEIETIADEPIEEAIAAPHSAEYHHDYHEESQGSWWAWLLGGLVAAALLAWIVVALVGSNVGQTQDTMTPSAPVPQITPASEIAPPVVPPGEVAPNAVAPDVPATDAIPPAIAPATIQPPAPGADNEASNAVSNLPPPR